MLNISNHPVCNWDDKQLEAAHHIAGDVTDCPFPDVDPHWGEERLKAEADSFSESVMHRYGCHDVVVHIAGEFCMCFALVSIFKAHGIRCVSSCTYRDVVDNGDGTKQSRFSFIRFRDY